MKKPKTISLQEMVGHGYADFWNFKGRYRVCKGSRASKKSKTMALWVISQMMKYPDANTLVVRKVYRTLKDSCFAELKWAADRLGVYDYWSFTTAPLEATYKPTGQKILFRGLDDPLKLTSITVEKGYLCWVWIEEAYEVTSETDFDLVDESIRGRMPEHLFKQITLTFNPWNERHWIKSRFFDSNDPEILSKTTNYLCNEWLSEADKKIFESMKERNPRRYQVAGLGNWGVVEGLIFENFKEEEFTPKQLLRQYPDIKTIHGLDFGYSIDPSAFIVAYYSPKAQTIWIYDELYKRGLTNSQIADEIRRMGYAKEKITADSAEPKSIAELKGYGLRVTGARKGKDSIMNGIQWLQNMEIIVHPRCVNFMTEIQNYTWKKDKFDKPTAEPIDDFNHLMDALRYGCEKYIIDKTDSIKIKTISGGI